MMSVNSRRGLLLAACCVLFLGVAVGSVSAGTIFDAVPLGAPVSLDVFVNPDGTSTAETIMVGDKLFENFTYSAVGDMPPVSAVNVIPIIDAGNYGIRLQAGFVDLPGGGASDALVTFDVTATRPGWAISDAHLVANPDVLVGGGLASITETFTPTLGGIQLTAFDNGTDLQLTDWAIFPNPVKSLNVQKDIFLLAGDNNPVGTTLSFVDQTFSQVPEPTSAVLMLAGLLGLAIRRRS